MKNILFTTALLSIWLLLGCSSDNDDTSGLTTEEQSILGVWEHTAYGSVDSNGNETITPINSSCLNTHTFTSDKVINYKSYITCNDVEEENGTWTFTNGLLTRTFPETVTVIQQHNVTFINPIKMKLFEVGNTSQFLIYEKQGETIEDTDYRFEVSGNYQTDWCGATNNTAKITFEFIQDGNVVATQNEQSSVEQSLTVNRNLTGNIIGVKLKLTDYNPSNPNSGLGDGFDTLHVKIKGNQSQDVYIDANQFHWLVNCTDICYEIDMQFNTSTKQLSVNSLWQ
ncbi:MAG: hypothetical protein IE891_01045 [Flavobacteriaceae bacterium]|nr:hypothetical protein [Flavobacteriaceae bacterium]